MTPQSPLDLLEVLAERCAGAHGPRPTASALLTELKSIDWAAHAALLQGAVAPPPTALVDSPEQVDRYRAAGWRVEEHPQFVGRKFVYERFEAFARSCRERGGIFIILAPAGCGKTALLTHWMDRGRTRSDKAAKAGFFFRYRDGRVSAAAMPEALWNQLGTTFAVAPGPLPSEAEFTARLEERLRTVTQGQLRAGERLLLFIDALDEADDPGRAASLIPKLLPQDVFVIASSRPPQQGQDHLAGLRAAGAEVFQLDPDGADNRRDLAVFFREQLAGLFEPRQDEQLADAAGGSFMLATLLAEAVRKDRLTVAEIVRRSRSWGELPTGERKLFGYYRECWDRACRLVDEDALAEFALLLAAAENWISERQVFAILQWHELRHAPRRDPLWSAGVFKRVTAALSWVIERRAWQQGGYASDFLQVRHQSVRDFVIALRHQSLRDFFTGTDSPTLLTPADMHAVIAEYYMTEGLQEGWATVDPYGRFYVVRHLLQTGRRKHVTAAAQLLSDPGYLQATLGDEPQAPEGRLEGGGT
jgi:hypothetical protein